MNPQKPYKQQWANTTALQLAADYQRNHPEESEDECLKAGHKLKNLDRRLAEWWALPPEKRPLLP
jgi:hypothetical protein